MGTYFVIDVEMVTETCSQCCVVFALPSQFISERKNDHKLFYCPWGHGQYYPQESDLEKIKKKAERLERCCITSQEEAATLERKLNCVKGGYRRQLNRLKAAL